MGRAKSNGEPGNLVFDPPLWLQRQAWALSVLRAEESLSSVLDVGCGEGSLLQVLCSPSTTIAEPPILPKPSSSTSPEEVKAVSNEHRQLHIQRLAGLDIDSSALESADRMLTHVREQNQKRWTQLRVDLWKGDFSLFNEELSMEAMVGLEVVEHLNNFDRFGPVILGEYRPKLLLITTPNYSFNARFDRQQTGAQGWKDPTGRTDRVFRHDDHKFEMTPSEFEAWTSSVAEDHGYSTEICHIGFPTESSTAENPLPPNSHFATNACIFRVLPTPPPSSIRSPRSYRSSPLPFYQKSADAEGRFGGSHQLFKRVMFRPRPSVEHVKKFKPGENAGLVRQCLRDLMKAWGVSEVKLSDVWSGADEYSDQLTDRCGGSQRFLIKALGGWGDADALAKEVDPTFESDIEVFKAKEDDPDLSIRWLRAPKRPHHEKESSGFDEAPRREAETNGKEEDTGGW